MDLDNLTIREAHKGLVQKKFSSVELTKACLERIKKVEEKIKAFITLSSEKALKEAQEIDKKIAKGENIGILEGIPVAIKDNILVEDLRCTSGSHILENYISPYNATVVKKLKEKGMILLGKTNMDEFAMGSSCETSYFGATHNPWDLNRVPGGSSGGSAAAVAANECIYALGSDTGGSIRQPASFCGVVGLKPTYGRVSRYGLMAMASSLDQIGPITKCAEDARIVLKAIQGKDSMDSTSTESKIQNLKSKIKDLKGLKIGIPKEYFMEGLDKEVEKKIEEAIKCLKGLGAKVQEVSLPHTKYALAVYYIAMPAEVSANLARFDGIRYGYSKVKSQKSPKESKLPTGQAKVKSLLDVYLRSREEGFGDEVRRRIMLGTYVLSAGYYEAYYLKAQKVRTLVKQDFDLAFGEVDCLVAPVSPTVAFKIGEKTQNPLTMYLSDVCTVPINPAGLPAISIPCGFAKPKGGKNEMPVGLQIIGPQFSEEIILQVAHLYEQATNWRFVAKRQI